MRGHRFWQMHPLNYFLSSKSYLSWAIEQLKPKPRIKVVKFLKYHFYLVKAKQIVLVTIPDDHQKIIIFFAGFIQTLGEQLKLRQQVIATATVFFKRFYALNPLKSIDPLLMAPTCIFLSSKVEEFGMISTRYAQYQHFHLPSQLHPIELRF